MAIPEPDFRMVGALAARVTNRNLVSFHGFMRVTPVRWLIPVLFLFAVIGSAAFLVAVSPTVRAQCGTASSACPPSPTATPVPVNAFISLDVTSGDPNTVINVTGGQFLANEQTSLYWDRADHVAGGATADANGNFNVRVKPFAGDPPGLHKLCASVLPNPCAQFTLNAPAPSPSPTAAPSQTPAPSTAASPVRLPITPAGTTLNSFDVITRPPFVFLPLIGLAAIAVSLGYWVLSLVRRPRPVQLRSAAVVHRAMRPDYSAGFGAPPPAPAAPGPETSTWADVEPAPPPVEPPSPVWEGEASSAEWGTGTPDSGYPFAPPEELPESEEPPKPSD